MEQRIEKFFGPGTMGGEDGKQTLEAVVGRVNKEGWKVDQILPLTFARNQYGGEELTTGIVLCTKLETSK